MKPHSSDNTYILGVLKDSLIIAFLFVSLCFIDIGVAVFISVITTAILLTRRIILYYNPGFITGHHINYNERELIVPKGVDVFDLSKVPAFEDLQRYTEVVRSILGHPSVLIIRFTEIWRLDEFDLYGLAEIIRQLEKSDIAVIFSDVGKNVQRQFREVNIEQKLGGENICNNIGDAMTQADNLLHRAKAK